MATEKNGTRKTTATTKKTTARQPATRKSTTRARKGEPAARSTVPAIDRSSDKYIPQTFEAQWETKWAADELYRTTPADERPKMYVLDFYPYPSGDGLSVGHCRNYVPTDALSRYYRMHGYNVLHPMGWDAFGLPAENAAIKMKTNPAKLIDQYAANYKRQFRLLGISFDWSREINSSKPEYYRWTQWIFLQLYNAWYDPRADKARPIETLEAELADKGTRDIPNAELLTAEQWKAMDRKARQDFLGNFRLGYRRPAVVNWDPVDKTVLANEEVVDGRGWRSGALVEKKTLMQWFFRITAYADRLIADMDTIDWPEHIKLMQRNWIGRSEGAEVDFGTDAGDLRIFTTRPDTLWGATFMVLSPEHPFVEKLATPEHKPEVEAYVARAKLESEAERTAESKEKTGVFTGAYATNPVNGERIPIWVADYVLMGYGTGAIMAVPGHDERDFAFALKFGLPIIPVIERTDGLTKSFALGGTMREGFADALRAEAIPFEERHGSLYITIPPEKVEHYIDIAQQYVVRGAWNEIVGTRWLFIFGPGEVMALDSMASDLSILKRCHALEPNVRGKRTVMEMLYAVEFYRDALFHADYHTMINSGRFSGTPGNEAVRRVTEWLEEIGKGKRRVNYKLRDWGISRQRYWGTPIPVIHSDQGDYAVAEDQLPVKLPDVESYEPTATGESPLATIPKFVNVTLPDGTPGRRETDTMGTFACSSWYYMRFSDPHNDKALFSKDEVSYWLPVDTYVGGAEHAVMHLLYSRFWTKVLYDLGHIPFIEPFTRLRNQGMILAPDGKEKMSKSKGNVVTPDEVVAEHGGDALRAYEMFISDFEQATPWSTAGLGGTYRWLRKAWELLLAPSDRRAADATTAQADRDLRRIMHKTIRKVSHDIEGFSFNTVISTLMEFTNAIGDAKNVSDAAYEEARETLLLLLAPVAPFMAEEVWARKGRPYSIHQQKWPKYDEKLAADDVMVLPIQVNGKLRDRIELPVTASEADVTSAALKAENVQRHLAGKSPSQVIYVPKRLVSIVVK
ncbi:MAG: leucine--tRNA ligase [Chloroflexi bacterium]|nr:leucine--tRNA ligase [Chloroflexota bacterium]